MEDENTMVPETGTIDHTGPEWYQMEIPLDEIGRYIHTDLKTAARRLPQGRPHDALYREVYGLPCGGYDQVKRRENREVVAVNVLKSVVIIMWAITGTVNLIRHNIDRWEYLMVWGSLMAVLMIWR